MTRTMSFSCLVLCALSCILVMVGCMENDDTTILPDNVRLRPGDMVLRMGNGLASHAVLMADGGGTYSHIGIAVDSAGTLMIVHAVPGEPDYPGDEDRVKMESPQRFYAAVNAVTGRILRFPDSVTARRAAQAAMGVYRRHTLFDHDYDASDTTQMYCCELVEFAYCKAGHPLVGKGIHQVNLPGLKIRDVIFPSDFIRSPELATVAAFGK